MLSSWRRYELVLLLVGNGEAAARVLGLFRFGELKAMIQGVSPKVLAQTLRSMERDGLVERRVTASIPPRVDYELTALGTTLIEPMTALRHWAQDNMQAVLEARERYDAAALKKGALENGDV